MKKYTSGTMTIGWCDDSVKGQNVGRTERALKFSEYKLKCIKDEIKFWEEEVKFWKQKMGEKIISWNRPNKPLKNITVKKKHV